MAPDRKPAEAKKRPTQRGWGEVRGQMFWCEKKTIEEEVAKRIFFCDDKEGAIVGVKQI